MEMKIEISTFNFEFKTGTFENTFLENVNSLQKMITEKTGRREIYSKKLSTMIMSHIYYDEKRNSSGHKYFQVNNELFYVNWFLFINKISVIMLEITNERYSIDNFDRKMGINFLRFLAEEKIKIKFEKYENFDNNKKELESVYKERLGIQINDPISTKKIFVMKKRGDYYIEGLRIYGAVYKIKIQFNDEKIYKKHSKSKAKVAEFFRNKNFEKELQALVYLR